MAAPEVIAKGAGDLALKMRQTARKHNVPIVENKKLARILFKETDINHSIPEKEFPVVAKILVWAFALRDRQHNLQQSTVRG
jgi:flagellar biosynthetic protein FlhB